jgi:phosphoribosyl-AMP cyclohydrolase
VPTQLFTFAPRGDLEAVETGTVLMPKFDRDGLIVAIAIDAVTSEVLMVAHMNEEALARTIATGEGWFWSRSRKELWRKGDTSGNRLTVREMRVDCDQDAILLKVEVAGDGAACHRGYRSCFYRRVGLDQAAGPSLAFDEEMPRPALHGAAG